MNIDSMTADFRSRSRTSEVEALAGVNAILEPVAREDVAERELEGLARERRPRPVWSSLDSGTPNRVALSLRISTGVSSCMIRTIYARIFRKAWAHSGSNCRPDWASTSANASSGGRPFLLTWYGRFEVMASKASATATMRARRGISFFAKRSG